MVNTADVVASSQKVVVYFMSRASFEKCVASDKSTRRWNQDNTCLSHESLETAQHLNTVTTSLLTQSERSEGCRCQPGQRQMMEVLGPNADLSMENPPNFNPDQNSYVWQIFDRLPKVHERIASLNHMAHHAQRNSLSDDGARNDSLLSRPQRIKKLAKMALPPGAPGHRFHEDGNQPSAITPRPTTSAAPKPAAPWERSVVSAPTTVQRRRGTTASPRARQLRTPRPGGLQGQVSPKPPPSAGSHREKAQNSCEQDTVAHGAHRRNGMVHQGDSLRRDSSDSERPHQQTPGRASSDIKEHRDTPSLHHRRTAAPHSAPMQRMPVRMLPFVDWRDHQAIVYGGALQRARFESREAERRKRKQLSQENALRRSTPNMHLGLQGPTSISMLPRSVDP